MFVLFHLDIGTLVKHIQSVFCVAGNSEQLWACLLHNSGLIFGQVCSLFSASVLGLFTPSSGLVYCDFLGLFTAQFLGLFTAQFLPCLLPSSGRV